MTKEHKVQMHNRVDIGIGIDCGSSGVRATALNHLGHCIAQSQQPLVEQTANTWWQTISAVMDDLSIQLQQHCRNHKAMIDQCAISFDATSSTLLLINSVGEPISDVCMYYQGFPEYRQFLSDCLPNTSGAQGANSSLAKVLALSAHLSAHTHWMVCHQADWIAYQLTSVLGITDENNALKLGYDVVNRRWPVEILSLIPESALPRVYPPATPFARLLPKLAMCWQLPIQTQVATGTTDSIAAFIATKANRLGDAVISLGSTLAFKLLCDKPYYQAASGIYSHRLWDQWLVGGASNAGGAVLLEHFSLADIMTLSAQIDITVRQNVDYYPLPSATKGERFPMANPEQLPKLYPKPATDAEFVQAMLEGLVAIEQQGWQQLESLSRQSIHRLFACGGGTKNPAWAGLRDQQLHYASAVPFSQEAAVGSALLALRSFCVQLAQPF